MDKGTENVVYFIEHGGTGNIKIGLTSDIRTRVSALRSAAGGVDVRLLGIVPGGAEIEYQLHKRFSDLHISGEWYAPGGRILHYIQKNAHRPDIDFCEHGGARSGAGRKSLKETYSEPAVQLTARLPESYHQHISTQDVSAAEYIRRLIERDMGD